MATKPTQQPEIWASALNYSSGPKIGQPTKATTEAGAAIEGHKPGPTEPTTCNEFNVFENKMSLLARWLFAGRSDKFPDAHVVETDSGGLLSAMKIDLGDPSQPGPAINVVSSVTNWMAKFHATNSDGFRLEGSYDPGSDKRLMALFSDQDNVAQLAMITLTAQVAPSCAGIRILAAAAGTIDGENLMAALDVINSGGTALQVRSSDSMLPAARFISLMDGSTSARFGFGNLETVAVLDGTGMESRGGDADGASFQSRAGSGGIFQGGDFTTTGTPKSAGHGLVALTGLTDAGAPGGAAVFAQTIGPRGIAVEGSHNDSGATLPVFQSTTGDNAATAYKAIVTGSGNGLDVDAQAGTGVFITMTPDGGGDLATHIRLTPITQLPTVTLSAGKIWCQQILGRIYLRAGLGTGTTGFVKVTHQSPCYARSLSVTDFVMDGSETDEEVLPEFTWDVNNLPAENLTRVRVTIWGQIRTDSNPEADITLNVRDKTAVGNPVICSIQIRTPGTSINSDFRFSTTFAEVYVLPLAGTRTFDMVWTGSTGSPPLDSRFTGWVEIEEISGA